VANRRHFGTNRGADGASGTVQSTVRAPMREVIHNRPMPITPQPTWLQHYLRHHRSYEVMLAVAVVSISAAVYAYRYVLLRLQGEARVQAEPEAGPAESTDRPQRFLVRKLGKEFLIAAGDIEWLEAQGNYVNLHVRGRAYPLRSTMTAIEQLLDPVKFARVHRSYIVNLGGPRPPRRDRTARQRRCAIEVARRQHRAVQSNVSWAVA
jgi:DNA-binding LytR/AlgR family response regulator